MRDVVKPTRTIHGWISVIGLIYVVLITLRVEFIRAFLVEDPFLPRLAFYGGLAALLLVAALSILAGKRRSYRFGLTVAAVFLIFHISSFQGLGNLTNPEFFLNVISPVPVLSLVVFHTIRGHRDLHEKTTVFTHRGTRKLLLPASLVGAFVVGGVLFGVAASGTQSDFGSVTQVARDVTIVEGAFHPANLQAYVPAKLIVQAGQTVVWYNEDTTRHTVTSVTGVFDSGEMARNAVWSHRFAQVGTYEYTCAYHPLMRGTIIVNEGQLP